MDPSKFPFSDYFLLAARVLLAWTLYRYGWSKLTEGQFGVDEKTMNMALKDIDLFRVSWYLANHQPFKSFIGISQIVCALLLTFNRTVIMGAFVSIPIWLNILMWDLTFMEGMTVAFTFRLSYYIILATLLIYQQKNRVLPALIRVTEQNMTTKFPLWTYAILPLAAIGIELIGAIPNAVLHYLR